MQYYIPLGTARRLALQVGSMDNIDIYQAILAIREQDARYKHDAYLFVRDALDYTVKRIDAKMPDRKTRHITGQELLEGIRNFALQQYGPMTFTVLQSWGVNRCEDFGEIVFNLVETGMFSKTEEDSRSDFTGCYNFDEAFKQPFIPKRKINQELNNDENIT